MSQHELENVSKNYIFSKMSDISHELFFLLDAKMELMSEYLSYETVRHIQSCALFDTLAKINYPKQTKIDDEQFRSAYIEHVNQKADEFEALCESLHNFKFQPENKQEIPF